jgi:signal transduction histidine kinase
MAVGEFADWCAIDLLEGDSLKRVAVAHPESAKVELAKRFAEKYPPDRNAPTGAWHVLRTGKPDFFPEISEQMLQAAGLGEEQLAMVRELGLHSAISVPLVGRSQAIGVLTLVQAESGRLLTESDLWISQQLGRHAALAIEAAALHRELKEQHALLADAASELEQQTEELQAQAVHMEDLMSELEASNEELQVRTIEAEEANRTKADFLATMSHELRTPLNAIFGYADLLDLGLHGPVTDEQHQALERIKRNQRSLLALINDVLNFAKVEAGKLELVIGEIPVGDVISDLESIVAPQLHVKGLEYQFDAGPDAPRVECDRERLEQILLNLLTNAIKFTDSGGTISVGVDANAETVRFSVRDTGCGIPPARLRSIFDPFVQLDRSTTDGGDRGVGLGLAISRNLASAMGGDLSVSSEVGRGSVFTLTLPRVGRT